MRSKKNNLIYSFLGGIEDIITDTIKYEDNLTDIIRDEDNLIYSLGSEDNLTNTIKYEIFQIILEIEDNLTDIIRDGEQFNIFLRNRRHFN